MDIQTFCNDIADGHAGIQRSIRILEHHLCFLAELHQFFPFQLRGIFSTVQHLPGGRLIHADQRSGTGRLPAAAFANQSEGFPGVNLKRHVIHRMKFMSLSRRKVFLQILHFQHDFFRHGIPPSRTVHRPAFSPGHTASRMLRGPAQTGRPEAACSDMPACSTGSGCRNRTQLAD